nr:hypothetical protein [Tanacetum cinerariifolium]
MATRSTKGDESSITNAPSFGECVFWETAASSDMNRTPLSPSPTGFSGEVSRPFGKIDLEIIVGEGTRSIDGPSATALGFNSPDKCIMKKVNKNKRSERNARRYFQQLIDAIAYCYRKVGKFKRPNPNTTHAVKPNNEKKSSEIGTKGSYANVVSEKNTTTGVGAVKLVKDEKEVKRMVLNENDLVKMDYLAEAVLAKVREVEVMTKLYGILEHEGFNVFEVEVTGVTYLVRVRETGICSIKIKKDAFPSESDYRLDSSFEDENNDGLKSLDPDILKWPDEKENKEK